MKPENYDRMSLLIQEAMRRLTEMDPRYELALQPAFNNALDILSTSAGSLSQQGLLLSAAQRPILEAEKKVGDSLIHDPDVSIDENTHLARIKSICFELRQLMRKSQEITKSNNRYHFTSL